MTKCPFCAYENDDGSLYCAQCRFDLGAGPVNAAGSPIPFAQLPSAGIAPFGEPLALDGPPFDLFGDAEAIPTVGPIEEAPLRTDTPAPPAACIAPAVPTLPEVAMPDTAPFTTQPRLVVLRGQRLEVEYLIWEGTNFLGRADDKPVDIDLEDQEPPDRIWSSRQHAVIRCEQGLLTIEDLNSSNGTFVNRSRLYPGQNRALRAGDIIQIGTVQLQVRS